MASIRTGKCSIDLGLIAPGTALDKANKAHAAIREGSKSFRYAFLYGAGAAQAGRIVGNIIRTVAQIAPDNGLHQQFFGNAARPNEIKLKQIGKNAINKFIRGTPGLQRLRAKLEDGTRRHGWLPGLYGRRIPARALYTTLNFLVTSSEAIICKRWLVNVYDELKERFRYGWDGDVVLVLWIHDELCACCSSGNRRTDRRDHGAARQRGRRVLRLQGAARSRLQDRPQLGRGSA